MKSVVAKSCSIALVCLFSVGAWADTPLAKTSASQSANGGSVKWTLLVGDQTFGMRPQGGPIPLPTELEWSCRYSELRSIKSGKNAQDNVVHVTCTRSDSRFSFKTVCTHPIHGDDPSNEASSTSSQVVTLYSASQIIPLGVSCESL
jgi:hypothetical protein